MNRATALSARYESRVVAPVSLPISTPSVLGPDSAVVRASAVQDASPSIVSWMDAGGKARKGGCFGGRIPDGNQTGVTWEIPTDSTPPDIVGIVAGDGEGKGRREGCQQGTAGEDLVGEG